ncbi:MAG: hypothetical protein MZV49_24120 [Rhodopseudomonas palustris]|nr:hypothetical protein [Rhodopseudomonas palustris]
MACSECCYWLRHHEEVNPNGFAELCNLLDLAEEGEPIREMVQEWLDEYKPKVNSVSESPSRSRRLRRRRRSISRAAYYQPKQRRRART